MDIKDLAGLSEPLKRLIDVVSDGIGAVCAPYLISRNAEARAHEIRVISDALNEVATKHQLPVVYKEGKIELWQKPEDRTLVLDAKPLEERSNLRLEYQERKRQHNLESVTSVAAAELADETAVPEDTPNEDWVTRFFSSAQDVSSEQMQDLWGRILAGEIKRPGRYSLRTLDFIRNLSTLDAQLLEHVGRFALQVRGTSFIPMHNKGWLEKERNVHAQNHFELAELGILYPTELQFVVFGGAESDREVFFLNDHLLLVKRGGSKGTIQVSAWKFTNVGLEILPLIPQPYDEEFLTGLGQFLMQRNGEALIGRITDRLPNDQVRYDTIKVIEMPDTGVPAS